MPSRTQVRRGAQMAAALAVGAVAIVVVYAVNRWRTDVPFSHLLRDPSHVTGSSPWVGALVFVGWFGFAAAGVLLLTAAWLRRRVGRGEERVGFLVTAAGLTALALADDAFQLHESVLVDATGLAERVWYVLWAAVVVVWVVAFRRELVRSPPSWPWPQACWPPPRRSTPFP